MSLIGPACAFNVAQSEQFYLINFSLWCKLSLKRLYVEHVIMPSEINPRTQTRNHCYIVSLMNVSDQYDLNVTYSDMKLHL